ncbi:MAG: GNAT family N-acetyltransferase [Acidobacteriota bacterium]
MNIRPEKPDDYDQIYLVNKTAFNSDYEPKLVDRLRKSSWVTPQLSIVAEKEGEVIGHSLFSEVEIVAEDGYDTIILSLGPVAVLPEYQGQGIGGKLIRAGIIKARELGYKAVVLVGHPSYYLRFGFVPAYPEGIETSLEVPDEAFMVLELQPGALGRIKGMIHYPPEWEL